MKTSAIDLLYQVLTTASTKCEECKNVLVQSRNIIKQAQKCEEQLEALSGPFMESCPLSEIPGYLPKLQGCVAGKMGDYIMHWKDNKERLRLLCDEVLEQCDNADSVYWSGPPDLPAGTDPCCPRPETVLMTMHDSRHAFSQVLQILQFEDEDLQKATRLELSNISQDLEEMLASIGALEERLQVCTFAIAAAGDDDFSN